MAGLKHSRISNNCYFHIQVTQHRATMIENRWLSIALGMGKPVPRKRKEETFLRASCWAPHWRAENGSQGTQYPKPSLTFSLWSTLLPPAVSFPFYPNSLLYQPSHSTGWCGSASWTTNKTEHSKKKTLLHFRAVLQVWGALRSVHLAKYLRLMPSDF